MSLLPQRKKSAEEIAHLRETLGVPTLPVGEVESPATAPLDTLTPTRHQAILTHPPEAPPIEAPPAPVPLGPKPVHSLKRSERTPEPELPAEKSNPTPTPATAPPKIVRSLRKSERVPIHVPAPTEISEDSKLPIHRHSDEEIAGIRRREILALLNPAPPNPKLAAAHPALLIPGYLLAITGASCFIFREFPMNATAGCAAAALAIAGFVFLRRPISRHHAAFIAVIALFVIVFGALHFFPQLRNAT